MMHAMFATCIYTCYRWFSELLIKFISVACWQDACDERCGQVFIQTMQLCLIVHEVLAHLYTYATL